MEKECKLGTIEIVHEKKPSVESETEYITVDESILQQELNKDRSDIEKKYISLYVARKTLSKIGTMREREVCSRQLARMKKFGLDSIR
jgi:hypothetical protein